MQPLRTLTIAGASLCAALGAGLMFQPEEAQPTDAGPTAAQNLAVVSDADHPVDGSVDSPVEVRSSAAMLPGTGLSALLGTQIQPSGTDPTPASGRADDMPADCAPQLTLAAQPLAMISVSVTAPCLPAGLPITILHGPLALTEPLGEDGSLDIALPALSPDALVTVVPAEGEALTDEIAIVDFNDHPRLVLDWAGPAEISLHGFLDGAGWGEAGHIRLAATPDAAGFVTELGHAGPVRALILTYPAGVLPHDGRVLVEGDVAVDPETCGQRINANVSLVQANAPVGRMVLRLDMPECGSPAGFVHLGDMLPENTAPALDVDLGGDIGSDPDAAMRRDFNPRAWTGDGDADPLHLAVLEQGATILH